MDRSRWVATAITASLAAAVLLSQGFVLAAEGVERMEALSSDTPPEAEWEHRVSPTLIYASAGLWALCGAAVAYAWGKLRAGRRPRATKGATPVEEDDEDRLARPPGFAGPQVRTRRKGLAPLLGFNALGILLLAGGATAVVLGVLTLEQTITMDGRGFRQAVTFGRITLYAGLPGVLLGAGSLGLAWGRWWPLGELEVVDEAQAQARLVHKVKWNRQ